jgi:hypothetical protein
MTNDGRLAVACRRAFRAIETAREGEVGHLCEPHAGEYILEAAIDFDHA